MSFVTSNKEINRITNRKKLIAWSVGQRPIAGKKEGSIGTIIYFKVPHLSFFIEKREMKCGEK